MALTRLNKVIADAGITSRRGADELISEGRVSVNGLVTRELGIKVDQKSLKLWLMVRQLLQVSLRLTLHFINHVALCLLCMTQRGDHL